MKTKRVIIVGGGLAGLACAIELIDHGLDVTVLESSPILGGKAASWHDEDGDIVDLGLHVVTPLYEHLLELLRKVGAHENIVWRDGNYYLALRGGKVDSIRIASLPAPMHFLAGLLRYRKLRLLDRLSGLPAFAEILLSTDRHRRKFDLWTFRDWARSRGATENLVAHLFDPMVEGLMFLDCHHVSTTNVMFDLHYMLLNKESSRLGFIDGGLNEKMIAPIAGHITASGGVILTEQDVSRFRFGRNRIEALELATGEVLSADAYVAAVPVHRIQEMLPDDAFDDPYFANLCRFEPAPVIGVQLWFDRKVTDISDLILTPKCIFNAYADVSNIISEYRSRSGSIVHFVLAPAGHLLALSDRRIVRLVHEDFGDVFPVARDARVVKSTVVRTPKAFYRQYPGMEQYRPPQRTPLDNLFLAGDFTRNKYPPCMEGAVKSGQLAAECLLKAVQTGSDVPTEQ